MNHVVERELFPIRRRREKAAVYYVWLRSGNQAWKERELWPIWWPVAEVVEFLVEKYSGVPGHLQCISREARSGVDEFIWLAGEQE